MTTVVGGTLLPGSTFILSVAHGVTGNSKQLVGLGPFPNAQFAPFGMCPFPGIITINAGSGNVRGYTGFYKVAGYCLDAATLMPLRKQVFLCPELSPVLCIASTFSDPITGHFEFDNLATGQYIIQGHDQDKLVNDVVFALVSSVPM